MDKSTLSKEVLQQAIDNRTVDQATLFAALTAAECDARSYWFNVPLDDEHSAVFTPVRFLYHDKVQSMCNRLQFYGNHPDNSKKVISGFLGAFINHEGDMRTFRLRIKLGDRVFASVPLDLDHAQLLQSIIVRAAATVNR